jgi:hypothetical protein
MKNSGDADGLGRRDLLRGIVGAGAASALGCAGQQAAARQPDLIRRENAKPGTRDWILTNTRIDPPTKHRCPWIEGFASRQSVRAGQKLSFHVSTNPASPFTIDLYRMGFYGGTGARHLATLGPFQGVTQPEPPTGPKRRRECAWEPCHALTVPADWPSGVYLGKLTAEREMLQSYLVFIVRDDRPADVLLQCSDTTWHAYNRWPSQFALYDNGKSGWWWGPGVEVSFDRPYGKYCQILNAPLSTGSGEWLLWEFPLGFWLEERGIDVTYISNVDTHEDPAGLRRAKGLLSVGHDEYYSLAMFNNLKGAIADGLSVAFLSGNTCCGLIEFHPSSDGRPNRVIERVDRFGAVEPRENNTFPDMKLLPNKAPRESELIGARSIPPVTGGAPWTCVKPDHWLFEGTGMKAGDGIPGLVGWEWHGDPAKIPGLEVVASGTAKSGKQEGIYTATVYPGPKGNIVFNAATIWWSDGLSAPPGYMHPSAHGASPKGPDPRVQRMTSNLLDRMRRA